MNVTLRLAGLAGLLGVGGLAAALPAVAACVPPPVGCRQTDCDVGFCSGGDPLTPPRPEVPGAGGDSGAPARRYLFVPACTGNSPLTDGVLCELATKSCPRPGDIRYWVYVLSTAGAAQSDRWVRELNPPSMCLGGATVTALSPLTGLINAMRKDWKSFPLPAASVLTQPSERTLVGAVTRFRANSPGMSTLPSKMILGFPVSLHVKATRYVWDFGDGTTWSTDVQPGAMAPAVGYTYRQPGALDGYTSHLLRRHIHHSRRCASLRIARRGGCSGGPRRLERT